MPIVDGPDGRRLLLDAQGAPLGTYDHDERGGLVYADLFKREPDIAPEPAAQAVLAELHGMRVAGDEALGRALSPPEVGNPARAPDVARHRRAAAMPDAARLPLTDVDRPAADLVDASAPHMRAVTSTAATSPYEQALAILDDYVSGRAFGPLRRGSGLAVDSCGAVAGGLLIGTLPGDPPLNGPWLIELFPSGHRGVGRALLERALALADAPALGLLVTEGNPARRLYDALKNLQARANRADGADLTRNAFALGHDAAGVVDERPVAAVARARAPRRSGTPRAGARRARRQVRVVAAPEHEGGPVERAQRGREPLAGGADVGDRAVELAARPAASRGRSRRTCGRRTRAGSRAGCPRRSSARKPGPRRGRHEQLARARASARGARARASGSRAGRRCRCSTALANRSGSPAAQRSPHGPPKSWATRWARSMPSASSARPTKAAWRVDRLREAVGACGLAEPRRVPRHRARRRPTAASSGSQSAPEPGLPCRKTTASPASGGPASRSGVRTPPTRSSPCGRPRSRRASAGARPAQHAPGDRGAQQRAAAARACRPRR